MKKAVLTMMLALVMVLGTVTVAYAQFDFHRHSCGASAVCLDSDVQPEVDITPFSEFPDTGTATILVSISSQHSGHVFDDIGLMLERLNSRFAATGAQQFDFYQMELVEADLINNLEFISQFDAVFVNCANPQYRMNGGVARQYAAGGGILYVSDLGSATLREAFPELNIQFYPKPYIEDIGTVYPYFTNELIVEDPFLQAVVSAAITDDNARSAFNNTRRLMGIEWDPGLVVTDMNMEIANGWGLTSFASGVRTPGGAGIDHSLFAFEFGAGRVYNLSFHVADDMTPETEAIVAHMALNIGISNNPAVTSIRAKAAEWMMNTPFLSTVMTDSLEAGQTYSFPFTVQPNSSDIAIINNRDFMSNFTMVLTSPTFRVYEGGPNHTQGISGTLDAMTVYNEGMDGMAIRNPIAGQWLLEIIPADTTEFYIAFARGRLDLGMFPSQSVEAVVQFRTPLWRQWIGPINLGAVNRSEPSSQSVVTANDGEVEIVARNEGGRLTLSIPSSPFTVINEMIAGTSDDQLVIDINNFSGVTSVAIPANAIQRFAAAGVDIVISGDTETVIDLRRYRQRVTGFIVIPLNVA